MHWMLFSSVMALVEHDQVEIGDFYVTVAYDVKQDLASGYDDLK